MNPVRNRVRMSKEKIMNKKLVGNTKDNRRKAQGAYAYYF